MDTIKFNQFNVTNKATGAKAKVWYSLDNRTDNRACVTLYDREYGRDLAEVFANIDCAYTNTTDTMTDHFDKGHVTLFADHPLYAAARERGELNAAKQAEKSAKRRATWDAAYNAARGLV